jgi:RHS repeat-associated protein
MRILLAVSASFARPILLAFSLMITVVGVLSTGGISAHSTPFTNATNRPPVANSGSYTLHNSQLIGPFPISDPDGDVVYGSITSPPAHGTLDTSVYGALFPRYTPNAGFSGSDSLTYQGCDQYNACASATVTIQVVNQAPSTNSASYTLHNAQYLGPFYGQDPDGDTIYSSITVPPAHGTVSTNNYGALYPYYTPAPGFSGFDTLTYEVCDTFNACSSSTVTIQVINQPPVAKDSSFNIAGASYAGPLYGQDPDSDPIYSSISVPPAHGTVDTRNFGALYPYYIPAQGYTGPDSFRYIVCDNFNACAQGTVYINNDDANAGETSCNAFVGQPINVTNGNMYLHQSDYQLPGAGEAFNLTRTYNSNSLHVNLFGRGWSTAYDEAIKTYNNANPRLYLSDGRAIDFSGSGTLTPAQGDFHGQLAQNGNGTYTLTFKDGRVHQFNAAGKLISLADRNNNQTLLAYDANGNLASVTDPFGRVLTITISNGRVLSISDGMGVVATYTYGSGDKLQTVTYADNSGYQFAYNSSNLLTSVTDALGHVLESHTYDSSGRALTSQKHGGVELYTLDYYSSTQTNVTDALGHITKYFFDKSKGRNVVTRIEGSCACSGTSAQTWTYDNKLNILSKTDAANQTTTFTYDASGNPLTATNVLGTTTFTYDGHGQVLTATDPMQGVTTNTYDAKGNLLTTKDALNNTTTFTYDTRGQLLTVKDARNNVTTLTWDASGRLTEVKDADNNTTAYGYDGRGRVVTSTNALTETTSYEYDAAGRPKKVVHADTSYIQFTYDLGGRRTKVRDARGNETTFVYDEANRLTSVTNADNKTTSYNYNLMSLLTSRTDALNRTTNYEYDDFNRLVKTIYPAAATGATRLEENLEYNAVGKVEKRIDTAARVTLYEYDAAQRLVKVTDPALKITEYEYNARSQMTAVVDALNQRYEFAYDPLGRVTQITRGGISMSYTYDAVGNRTARTDYNNVMTSYAYDNLNRLETITYPDSSTVTYAYDELSRLDSATNVNGTVAYTYDNRGRVSGVTDVFSQTLAYDYDANGNRTQLTLGQTTNATYQYDALNRLTQLTDNQSAATTYSYDATDKLTGRTLPNGIASSYQYDGMDRLTRLQQVKGATTVADYQYQFNTASNITQQTEPAGTHNYAYDAIDRLTAATHPSQTNESYSYDAVGNRTASHHTTSYTYQPFNKVVSLGAHSYTYDANGNLTQKTDNTGTWTYAWDYENRLKQVTRPDTQSITYKYDALGRRVQRIPSNGDSTTYVYDGDDVIKDINSDGSTVEYLNGLGVDEKLRQTSSSTTLYFVHDHLGSARALTDVSGNVVESIDYDSFGNGASNLTRYGYTGREWEANSNLYYYRARWYDPQVGRFISEDPIGLDGGINLYVYVENNSLNLVDPSGLLPDLALRDNWLAKGENPLLPRSYIHIGFSPIPGVGGGIIISRTGIYKEITIAGTPGVSLTVPANGAAEPTLGWSGGPSYCYAGVCGSFTGGGEGKDQGASFEWGVGTPGKGNVFSYVYPPYTWKQMGQDIWNFFFRDSGCSQPRPKEYWDSHSWGGGGKGW